MQHVIEVWGDFACFTRPEMKVERYSYPCPTPSAAKGIFDAIYFKPEFRWKIDKIELLSYPEYIALRRNEVKDTISVNNILKWMKGKEINPIIVDDARTQRQTMALKNPRFRIYGHIELRDLSKNIISYDQQFIRRAKNGKCHRQPAFGCKEFVAFFKYCDTILEDPIDYNEDLGWMLYDIFWNEKIMPTLFYAKIEKGILMVPRTPSNIENAPGFADDISCGLK